MNRKILPEPLLRLAVLMLGLTIAHLGVTFFLLSALGSDPFNVLVQGSFRSLNSLTKWAALTHGRIHMAISFFIILVLLAVDRTYIKLGTLLCMFCGGPIIDVFSALLRPVLGTGSALWIRILAMAAGCIILAFGMTIVIKSDAGTGPNDLVALVLSDKLGKPFSIVRFCVDLTFILAGALLGGTWGLGTAASAVLVGPAAGFFMPLNEAWIKNLLRKTYRSRG